MNRARAAAPLSYAASIVSNVRTEVSTATTAPSLGRTISQMKTRHRLAARARTTRRHRGSQSGSFVIPAVCLAQSLNAPTGHVQFCRWGCNLTAAAWRFGGPHWRASRNSRPFLASLPSRRCPSIFRLRLWPVLLCVPNVQPLAKSLTNPLVTCVRGGVCADPELDATETLP